MKKKMRTLPYYICSKNFKEITGNTFGYQFEEKKAQEGNDLGADAFYSYSDEESSAVADEIDNRTFFIVTIQKKQPS